MGSENCLYLHADSHERAPSSQHTPWFLEGSCKTEAYVSTTESPAAATVGAILVVIFKDI